MCRNVRILIIGMIVVLFAVSALAQNTKGFRGNVKDRDGNDVAGVKVTFIDQSNKSNVFETETNEKGNYLYAGLPYASDGYAISVQLPKMPAVQKIEKPLMLEMLVVNFDMRTDLQMVEEEVEAGPAHAADAKTLFELEQYEDALAETELAIAEEDNVKAAMFMRAVCLLKLERFEESLAAFEKYEQDYPGQNDVVGQMATLYDKVGNDKKAKEYKKKFKESGGMIQGETYNEGVIAMNNGDMATAEAKFLEAIEEDPKDADAHRELSKVFAQTGKYSKAVEQLKIYLEKNPNADDRAVWEQAIQGLSQLQDVK